MTDKMAKVRAAKKPPKYKNIHPDVKALPDDDTLSVKNVKEWEKHNKECVKELKYKMVDFHSARPGHDLRYAMSGEYMKQLGWEPVVSLNERIQQVVELTLENDRWLKV